MSWKPVNQEETQTPQAPQGETMREIKEYPVGGDEPATTSTSMKEQLPGISAEDIAVVKSIAVKRGRPKLDKAAKESADPVNHPEHYKVGGIETIDFIEAKGLSYHLGNVVKYVTRADHKGNRLQDLEKAQWYLSREISRLKGE